MKPRILIFLLTSLFSYFGDMLAVMSIPLLLLKQKGDLLSATHFSLLAILSALLTSKPAAIVIRRIHPLRMILICDSLACAALLGLGFASDSLSTNPLIFLCACFVAAICINFPMFAKNQLLYQYFVDREQVSRVASIQGKLIGLVFVLSILSVGILFDRVGFKGVIVFDIVTYLPLLAICLSNGNKSNLGYPKIVEESIASQLVLRPQQKLHIALYHYFNCCVYFMATMRSHLMLSVLVAFAPRSSVISLAIPISCGTLLSLAADRVLTDYFASSITRAIVSASTCTLIIGFLLPYADLWWSVSAIGFFLTEANALNFKMLRKQQVAVGHYYPVSRMANLSVLLGSIVSIVLLPATMSALETIGPAATFLLIAVTLLLALPMLHGSSLKRLIATAGTGLIAAWVVSCNATASTLEYRTVMLDRPRLFFTPGANTMSEDERFIMNNIYCGLFKLDISQGITPELASSWSVEQNGTLFRFKIRRGMKDSDGVEIDTKYVYQSIKSSIEAGVQESAWKNPSSDIRGYMDLEGFESCRPGSCQLSGLTNRGDEIVIRLKRRQSNFLELLSRHMMPIFRRKSVNDGEVPVSCGPYKVASYSQSSMTLARNGPMAPDGAGSPERFTISFKGPQEAVQGFCQGRYNDLIFLVPTRQDLEKAGCKDSEILWREVDTAGYWAINLGSERMLQQPNLYQRVSAALSPQRFRDVWKIESREQKSSIPQVFGQPPSGKPGQGEFNVIKKRISSPYARQITVRYIDGTPHPDRLAKAVSEWLTQARVPYRLIATPFTEFTEDLFKGSSEIYIYAELATSKLENFLTPLYETNTRHFRGRKLKDLQVLWADFLAGVKPSAIWDLDRLFLSSKRFVPLYVFRRPLVFRNGFYVRQHSVLGLAALPISEFREGRP